MRKTYDKQDFYELRPMILIIIGLIGIFNFMFSSGGPWLVHFGQLCGFVLLFSAAKIMQWRKDYRSKYI